MRRPSLSLPVAGCILLAGLLLAVKLFTTEVKLRDEPTIGLALRSQPHLDNSIQVQQLEHASGLYLLVIDENDYIGGPIYRFLVGPGWLMGLALALILVSVSWLAHVRRRSASADS